MRVFLSQSDDRAAWVAAVNAGFFRPTDPAAISAGRPRFADAIALGRRAVAAARIEHDRARPSDAIFDWTVMPVSLLDDLEAFGAASELGLREGGMQPIPRLSPALSLDLASFFDDPFDGTAEGPLYSVVSESWGDYVATDNEAFQRLIARHLDSDPWAMGAPERTVDVHWDTIPTDTWKLLFDPGDRWSMAYGCH